MKIPAINRILVIGATGMLGRPVADQLKVDGFQVRVLSRSPQKAARLFGEDFEICQGDIEDRASLDQALQGCIGVHINLKGGPTAEDMESLPLFIQGKQALVIGKQPHPLHWVAAADYARMVSRSYQTSAAVNKALYIYGPQAITMRQALEVFCQRLMPQVSVKTMPIGWLALLGKITFQAEWQSLARLMACYDQVGEEGDPQEANEFLGAPQTNLATVV